jgi:acetoin utilization transport system ATP-binding protein
MQSVERQIREASQGRVLAVDDVSFKVNKGETFGIIGANGSGKTTLLKLINGIIMPDEGE